MAFLDPAVLARTIPHQHRMTMLHAGAFFTLRFPSEYRIRL
jgi:hypothetical protein